MSVVVTASLVVAVEAPATAAAARPFRDPQTLEPVPATSAVVKPAPEDVAARLAALARPISAPVWPTPAAAVADLSAAAAAARETGRLAPTVPQVTVISGGLPVRVAHAAGAGSVGATGSPSRLRVETLDPSAVQRAGGSGLAVRVARADGVSASATVSIGIGYTGVAGAFGADWAGRLRAAIAPDCALATPESAGCQPIAVVSRNDRTAGVVTASVSLPKADPVAMNAGVGDSPLVRAPGGGGVVVMLTAGDSSTAGDFTATSLKPSATWSAGGSTGDFGWSYPVRTPPSLGGPAPAVSFGYSSQSIDGLTSASNNQPSWLGDGFAYNPGFIERRYKACADDGHPNTGDQCWGTDNATLSMAGRGGELIQYSFAPAPELWRPVADDGTRVERLRNTGLGNGDNDGEHWKVTTTDGTQYFFGRNRIQGWSAGRPETNSTAYAPVFGDDAGEPCYVATYANAWCQQAYRWLLDYVVDLHGNTMSYWYTRETNNYSRNLTDSAVSSYVRANHLTRIDYGTDNRSGTDTTFSGVGTAPARVLFNLADRCALTSGCATHDAAHWPDVPWDRECTSGTNCSGRYSPTFWSTKRLSSVTTQVATGAAAWKDVDTWALVVQWLDPGIGDDTRIMWLNTVTQTGLNGAATDIVLPAVTFGPTATTMNSRVITTDGHGSFNRFRLATIANETGGSLGIAYSPVDCVPGSKMPAAPHTNTYRCFPVYWTPPGGSQMLDWYHKYVVASVGLSDAAGGNPNGGTTYTYPVDGGFWHYDESELTPPGRKTWGVWRGYEQVTETIGQVTPGAPQLQTITRFFRGAHGDKLPSGTRTQTYTVNGTVYNDENWLAGTVRENVVLNGPGGATVTESLTEPWASGPTATRTVDGVVTSAYATNTLRTTMKTKLDGGRPDRVAAVTNSFTDGADGTPRGRLLTVDDEGDVATAADDVCTRTTYASNDSLHIHALASEFETTGLRCSQTPTLASQVLSNQRTWYDGGATFPTTPTQGEVSRTEELSTWHAIPGNRVWTTTAESNYDDNGRLLETWDALDRRSALAYSPAAGAPVTSTTSTNPKNWTTTTLIEPAWGLPTRITDPNGRATDLGYDSLGRLTAVWLPGWDKVAHPTLPSKSFVYTVRNSGGPSAVASSSLNTAGTGSWTSYELFDGFLRPRQTQSLPPTGSGRVVTDTYHDSRGLQTKANAAYFATGAPGTTLLTTSDLAAPAQTRTSVDGAGRPTGTQLLSFAVERWHTTTSYGGDRVDATPLTGGTATSAISDARGRTTALRQYHGPTPTPGTPGSYDTTSYGYDHAGRLVSVVDHAGITWNWGYDQRGRQTSSVDPDKGTTSSDYDDADQLRSTTDARGVTLTHVLDELGRKTQTWQGPAVTGTKRAEWTYDTILLGQPAVSTRIDSGNAYTTTVTGYDAGNRPTGTSVTIPSIETGLAGTYSFGITYNANGSVADHSLPEAGGLAAETLATTYHPNGAPRKLTGANNYVTQTTYLQTGPITSMTHNTSTAYRSFNYDPVTLRMSHMNVQAATTPDVLKETDYSYDHAGNITKISDLLEQYGPASGSDDTQCFSYDHLRRLTAAWTPDSNNCATAPSVAGLGGAAPYWLSWTFDTTGNRTSQTLHTAGGNQTTNYTSPLPGQPQPHTLTSTSGAQAGTYDYDDAGNTISRPGVSAQQTLAWDPEGHLASITESSTTSTYLYDADGSRLITRDATGTTAHLPMGVELHVNAGGSGLTCTRIYTHAGNVVATRTSATGLSWLFNDHQGTAGIAVRHSGMVITRRHQAPYGTPRGTTPTWPNQHGYVNGFADGSGLTHLGARDYDPVLGRFVSVDPIMDMADPQQWNTYSYSNNTPVTASDPSGQLYTNEESGGGGGGGSGCGIAGGYASYYSGGKATCTGSSNFPGTSSQGYCRYRFCYPRRGGPPAPPQCPTLRWTDGTCLGSTKAPQLRKGNLANGSTQEALDMAASQGATCHFYPKQIVCFEASGYVIGNRPQTIGDVLLYPGPQAEYDQRLQDDLSNSRDVAKMCDKHGRCLNAAVYGLNLERHEVAHSDQWANYSGVAAYGAAYGLASLDSLAACGDGVKCNRFETEANLFQGGYIKEMPVLVNGEFQPNPAWPSWLQSVPIALTSTPRPQHGGHQP